MLKINYSRLNKAMYDLLVSEEKIKEIKNVPFSTSTTPTTSSTKGAYSSTSTPQKKGVQPLIPKPPLPQAQLLLRNIKSDEQDRQVWSVYG